MSASDGIENVDQVTVDQVTIAHWFSQEELERIAQRSAGREAGVRKVADLVIRYAKERFGGTDAEFDYSIAVDGSIALVSQRVEGSSHTPAGDARQEIDNAIYHLATAVGSDPEALRGRVRADLEQYFATAKARKYVGWSKHSDGPIRYGDAV